MIYNIFYASKISQENFSDIISALREKAWLIRQSILNFTELISEHGSRCTCNSWL